MSEKPASYIEVPASEVRRRVAETVAWYENGGRAKIEADWVVHQRNTYRKEFEGSMKGVFNRRPYSEEEIEAKVDEQMGGYKDFGLNGNAWVKMRMLSFDDYVNEMKNLAGAATADYNVQVRSFLWRMIVDHSSEPSDATVS